MQWSAAWSVSPVNNPHSHLKQKVGLIEPSSRAKNAKMFESCHYDFSRISPEVPPLHNPSSPWPPWWPWMALFGIALPKCTWHAATSAGQKSSRVQPSATFQSPTIRKKMEKCNVHIGKAGLFPVVGPCACFGAWGHVRHLANHCSTTPTTSPDSAFKHWVLKEFSCQVSRLNPAMHVDVRGVSQNQTPLRWIQYPFHRNGI